MSDSEESQTGSRVSPEEFQKMVYLYQLLQEQQGMLNEQLELLQQQIVSASVAKATMTGLQDLQADDEIIVPMGTMAFTRAKLIDPTKVMVGVSKQVVIEKDLPEGLAFIERMLQNYDKIQEKLSKELDEVNKKLHEMEPYINAIYQGMQQSQQARPKGKGK
jgi:prefoldin alpha subunit